MKKNLKTNLLKKAETALGTSGGLLRNLPAITLYGSSEAEIDNFKGLLDFSPSSVRINTSDSIIRIDGISLTISVMTDEDITITGTIKSLSFE